MNSWIKSLSDNGYLFIEWNKNNLTNSKSDPFAASIDDYKHIFNNNNSISLIEILEINSKQSLKPNCPSEEIQKDIIKYIFVLKKYRVNYI